MENKRAIVAISGASGATLGLRLVKILALADARVFCVPTAGAKNILPLEIDGAKDFPSALADICTEAEKPKLANVEFFDDGNFLAPPASGSFNFDAMAILPCSMKTLGKLANGIADNLALRAAEVALKERRRLVVCPRETPLSTIHLRNMSALSEAGAVILPPVVSFYNKPKIADDIADFIAARTAQSMGFKQNVFREWGL